MPQALVTLPPDIKAGQVVTVRTMVGHPMETGQRVDAQGRIVVQDIVRRLMVHFEGVLIFEAQLHAAIAANPYVAFDLRADRGGMLRFTWEGDRGFRHVEDVMLRVS